MWVFFQATAIQAWFSLVFHPMPFDQFLFFTNQLSSVSIALPPGTLPKPEDKNLRKMKQNKTTKLKKKTKTNKDSSCCQESKTEKAISAYTLGRVHACSVLLYILVFDIQFLQPVGSICFQERTLKTVRASEPLRMSFLRTQVIENVVIWVES